MSSILADQKRPRIWAQMQGDGELRGLTQGVQLYTGAQINFGDLTPYFTYEWLKLNYNDERTEPTKKVDEKKDMKSQKREVDDGILSLV